MDPLGHHLNLWKQQLGRVPDAVWEQSELQTLVLADNGLREISGRLGTLRKLRMLDLGHNQLTAVPESLGQLDSLTGFLYLHDNKLRALPSALAGLKRLRYLNISANEFDALPQAICGMESLFELRAWDLRLGTAELQLFLAVDVGDADGGLDAVA